VSFTPPDDKPVFSAEAFAALEGKHILLGITYLAHDGSFIEQQQVHGIVTAASEAGISIQLEGKREGEVFNLPPDLRGIEPAQPGVYTLRSTGEVVVDPDYVATWTITSPPQEH
jgi:hypothetical protein